MNLHSNVLRLRYLALILPAFALFTTLQVGCSIETNSKKDDFTQEDPSGSRGSTYGTYNTYDDDNDGYDTYGYE